MYLPSSKVQIVLKFKLRLLPSPGHCGQPPTAVIIYKCLPSLLYSFPQTITTMTPLGLSLLLPNFDSLSNLQWTSNLPDVHYLI